MRAYRRVKAKRSSNLMSLDPKGQQLTEAITEYLNVADGLPLHHCLKNDILQPTRVAEVLQLLIDMNLFGKALKSTLMAAISVYSLMSPASESLHFQVSRDCGAYDRGIFTHAIRNFETSYLACLNKYNAPLAQALQSTINENKTHIQCIEPGQTLASTSLRPDSAIYFSDGRPQLLRDFKFQDDGRTTQFVTSLLFHESFHLLKITHRYNMEKGEYQDSVYGCQQLCSDFPVDYTEIDSKIGCELCIRENLNGQLKLDDELILEQKIKSFCK